ncbi:MAG: hypothetical protein JO115_02585 [Pseudonocardiales bacterium]|nr:hypothetical protein [Pseudonocardiales bacterium]
MIELQAPSTSAHAETLADWIEVCSIVDTDRRCSREDLISALRIAGGIDAFEQFGPQGDVGSEMIQGLAESAMDIIENRAEILSGGRYPFIVSSGGIATSTVISEAGEIYQLLVLSSYFSGNIGGSNAEYTRLFEDIAAVAARDYLGGSTTNAKIYQMGSPRRSGQPSKFTDAVTDMCAKMHDGGLAKDQQQAVRMKDAKLDVVAWIPTPDRRQGKLIGFGQCATGKNWRDKISELQPDSWCASWMTDRFAVLPVRMFFIPHTIPSNDWLLVSYDAGMLFDRVRIVAHSKEVPSSIGVRVRRWLSAALGVEV